MTTHTFNRQPFLASSDAVFSGGLFTGGLAGCASIQAATPAARTVVTDFASLPALTRLDNTEGMCWGPVLPNGNRSLVFVSDDNINPRQITQFLAFEFLESTP